MANTTPGELSDMTLTYIPRNYIFNKRQTKEITAQHCNKDDEHKTLEQKKQLKFRTLSKTVDIWPNMKFKT